ncbi:hypothetical protein P8C59_007694 [Phyllachora maydis]|uniref:Brl1/Brr6 domain-containing protein n=1 Tax=Phyllachora maydis TaxID=1825666 RepID=A0AAD9IAT7_9PEZI|nr:hypothetical protein P8C59_007694 [Phyllachora maydis]
MQNPRAGGGPMEFEWQNAHGPRDPTSPFTQLPSWRGASSFASPMGLGSASNKAGGVFGSTAVAEPHQPPPSSSFNPKLGSRVAPAFRNKAFFTPQKSVSDVAMSDFSAAESSPAATDVSVTPKDTPDDGDDGSSHTRTVRGHSWVRPLLSGRRSTHVQHAPGKGELARTHRIEKPRKRRREGADRDVGTVRWRHPGGEPDGEAGDGDRDDSDPDGHRAKRAHTDARPTKSAAAAFLELLREHPHAPAILGSWLNLSVSAATTALVLGLVWAFAAAVRADMRDEVGRARAQLLEVARKCGEHYAANRCAPHVRVPAMDAQCDAWDACMKQDLAAVNYTAAMARSATKLLNEVVEGLSWKAWMFVATMILLLAVAKAIVAPGVRADSPMVAAAAAAAAAMGPAPARPATTFPSQPALFVPTPYSNGREVFYTPATGRWRRGRFADDDDASETDDSPAAGRGQGNGRFLPAGTPSRVRRSPSKTEGRRSPSKGVY